MAAQQFKKQLATLYEPGEVRRRWACEKALPPHLGPLPQGEEEPFDSFGADNERGRFIGPNACAKRKATVDEAKTGAEMGKFGADMPTGALRLDFRVLRGLIAGAEFLHFSHGKIAVPRKAAQIRNER